MIRVLLVSEVDEKDPPSAFFAARAAAIKPPSFPGGPSLVEVEVSVAQLQEMVRRLWRLLPPAERPCP